VGIAVVELPGVGVMVGGVEVLSVGDGVGVGNTVGICTTAVTGVDKSPQADTERTAISYVLPGLGLFTVYREAS
jgi:hypothetical protein